MEISENIRSLVAMSLREDIGQDDITTLATIPDSLDGRGFVKAKSTGILCGQDIFNEVFKQVDDRVRLQWHAGEGDKVAPGTLCVSIDGRMRSILKAERTALNFIQRMSGIATLTGQYVDRVRQTRAKIIDTRKTTPLLRELEKYAVRIGGGFNHRMGLYDMFLIKDNHIAAAGGIAQAIQSALTYKETNRLTFAIEVETKNIREVRDALGFPIQRIMLDNMDLTEMKEAVSLIDRRCEVEASGGVSLDTVEAIAATGVDFISIGALTHSAPALDLSLLVEKV